MFRRLKTALVDSFVGAIALGYLLAEALENLGFAVVAPLKHRMEQKELYWLSPTSVVPPSLSFRPALVPLIEGIIYLLLALVLLRWLYYDAPKNENSPQMPDPEQGAS